MSVAPDQRPNFPLRRFSLRRWASQFMPKRAAATPAVPAKPSKAVALWTGRVSWSFLIATPLTGLAALGLYYAALVGLQHGQNLPPPAFSNSICVDEKLQFLRDSRPAAAPNLLVVGSSVAWRHFDGEAVRQVAPGVVPLNGAFCGLSAHQAAYAAEWLLDRNPSVKQVVMIASPLDFEDCSSTPAAAFERREADNYVYKTASRWPYYLQYFDPVSLANNALAIRAKRTGQNKIDPISFDKYASGPLVTSDYRGLLYTAVTRQDPACYAAVAAFSEELHARGKRFMLVATPLHPEWKALPANLRTIPAFEHGLAAIPYAEFWSADDDHIAKRSDFFDAVHINWAAARPFSYALAVRFGLDRPEALPVASANTPDTGVHGPLT